MESVSEWMARLAPAAIVLKAIVVSLAGISALMIFITVRRWLRGRYFARRERQMFQARQQWNALINGQVRPETWRFDPLACEVLETMLLDSIEVSPAADLPRLVDCLRRGGLIDRRIDEARTAQGWKRWRALVALGRTRAPRQCRRWPMHWSRRTWRHASPPSAELENLHYPQRRFRCWNVSPTSACWCPLRWSRTPC
ncbi:MAG: hypothetical protein ACXVZI_06685 [Terriglobales bacterium]